MRVLLVHSYYRTPGGEESHVRLLEEGLHARGHEVRIFSAHPRESTGVAHRMGLGIGMTYRPAAFRGVKRVLLEWRPDVVHAHNLTPHLSPSVLHASKRHGAAVILTAHNYRLFCPSGTLTRRGKTHDDCVTGSSLSCALRGSREPWSERLAYGVAIALHRRLRVVDRWVDAVIAPSAFTADVLRRAKVAPGKLHVIPYGVETSDWAEQPRRFGLYCGRLAEEKGVKTLLDAHERAPDVPLVVTGSGPLEDAVGSRPGITYLGYVSAARVRELRSQAAFTVIPSEWPDVFPMTGLESLSAGTPVIATTVGGLPEMIDGDGSGLLVPPGEPQALAAAMRHLWDEASAGRSDFGRGAWDSARRRFDLDRQLTAVENLYREVGRGIE